MDTIIWPPYLCLLYRYLSYPSVRGKSEPLYGTHPPWGRRPIMFASNCRGNNFTQDGTVKGTHFHSENSLSTIRQSKAGSLANPSSINHVRDWNEHHEQAGRSSTDAQIHAHCDTLHSTHDVMFPEFDLPHLTSVGGGYTEKVRNLSYGGVWRNGSTAACTPNLSTRCRMASFKLLPLQLRW
jgi:hypothetical protein